MRPITLLATAFAANLALSCRVDAALENVVFVPELETGAPLLVPYARPKNGGIRMSESKQDKKFSVQRGKNSLPPREFSLGQKESDRGKADVKAQDEEERDELEPMKQAMRFHAG